MLIIETGEDCHQKGIGMLIPPSKGGSDGDKLAFFMGREEL